MSGLSIEKQWKKQNGGNAVELTKCKIQSRVGYYQSVIFDLLDYLTQKRFNREVCKFNHKFISGFIYLMPQVNA